MDRPDIVTLLLSHHLTDPNLNVGFKIIFYVVWLVSVFSQGIDGFTPLTFAVSKGSKDIVKILLAASAIDLNLRYCN